MDRKSPQMLAQMLLHLGRLAHGDVKVAGLTPAQWTVLRYFSSANRFSRTASAFASFHGTTRGTASQTIKSLVAKGDLERIRSKRDGRSARHYLDNVRHAFRPGRERRCRKRRSPCDPCRLFPRARAASARLCHHVPELPGLETIYCHSVL